MRWHQVSSPQICSPTERPAFLRACFTDAHAHGIHGQVLLGLTPKEVHNLGLDVGGPPSQPAPDPRNAAGEDSQTVWLVMSRADASVLLRRDARRAMRSAAGRLEGPPGGKSPGIWCRGSLGWRADRGERLYVIAEDAENSMGYRIQSSPVAAPPCRV